MTPEEVKTKQAIKSTYHIIEASVTMSNKVVFSEPLTADEAKDAFMNGDFEDVLDTEELSINFVTSVEPMEEDCDEDCEED